MVTGLAEDLLAYGDHYFETGDSQTATRLYEATRRMGEQVAGGADLARERQAGLDIQYASVEALAQAVGSDANQGRIDELTAASLDLTAGYEELRAIFETVNDLLFGENSLDFWDVVSEAILSGGDLNLLESLDLESI
jgi:hypothetical protein